jgi:hypothetical protein
MSHSSHTGRAVVALGLAAWSQACTAYRIPPADRPLVNGEEVRVTAQTSFIVGPPSAEDAWSPCMVTSVDGHVGRIAGDSILLVRVRDIEVVPRRDGSPGSCDHSAVSFVRSPATDLTVRQSDSGRTMLTLGAIAAAIVGLVALAASNMTYQ